MSLLPMLATLAVSAPTAQQPEIAKTIESCIREVDPARLRKSIDDLVSFGTRHVLSATDDPERGTGAARDYLEARYRALIPLSDGRLTVERKSYPVQAGRLGSDIEVVNIVATLKGVSDPDRIYIIGGHYDSRNSSGRDGERDAPGANDDGSGTVAVLEACRVMASKPFAATIMFIAYDGEEQGLLGAKAHAAELSEAGAKVDGMITCDIVGNTLGMDGVRRTDYLRCFSYAPRGNDSMGRSMARAATRGGSYVEGFDVRLIFRGDRYGRGGDHRAFYEQGFPAVRFTEPREDYSRQHQNITERDGRPYGDLPEFMDFDYLADVTRVNVATLAELASAPRVPLVGRPSGARGSYDTNVTFTPVDGAHAYEVVWRDTTAPDWTDARLFSLDELQPARRGSGARVVLEGVCIDDVVVGVRSVAGDGSRSRVATPPEPDAMATRGTRRRRGR